MSVPIMIFKGFIFSVYVPNQVRHDLFKKNNWIFIDFSVLISRIYIANNISLYLSNLN